MKKKNLLLPVLSGLLLSPFVLSQQVLADTATDGTTNLTTVNSDAHPETKLFDESTIVPVAAPAVEELPENTKDIVVLHTNDIHGRIEENAKAHTPVIGLAKLDGVVKEEQEKADQITLLVDAGDAFQGLPISNSSKGLDMLEIMNQMDYDAIAVGNHEFDFELDTVKVYKEKLKFPLLSVNTYVDNARLFETHTIIDKDKTVKGDEFVVIGVTTPETATKTHPKNVSGVEFRDPVTEVNKVIEEIEAKAKAEQVVYSNYIVLAHLGIDATTKEEWKGSTLAKALSTNPLLKDKKVILIDGHSHTVHTDKFGHVVYNQTGSYLENIGKIHLPQNGEIQASNLSYKDVAHVAPTKSIADMVAAVKEKFEKENSVVVIENNPVQLEGNRNHVRVRETNLGNAIADALYQYGQTGFSHKTDIAVTNGGGIRETIKKDQPVTKGDLIAVLPFGNIISQIEVTGEQLQQMFTKSLAAPLQSKEEKPVLDERGLPLLEANGPFLQVSGARVYYDTTKPVDQRILAITVFNKETNQYEPLDLTKTYYLATNDFIASGGDGYTMLSGAREEGPSMDVVFSDYLKSADLSAYTEVNPNSRLVAILEKDYKELLAKEEKKDGSEQMTKKNGAGVFVDLPVADLSPLTRPLPTPPSPNPLSPIDVAQATQLSTRKQQETHSVAEVSSPTTKGLASETGTATLPKTGSQTGLVTSLFGFALAGLGLAAASKRKWNQD